MWPSAHSSRIFESLRWAVLTALQHNRTAAAVALRWVVQQGVPIVTSSDKAAHVADDVQHVFDFQLSAREMATLAEIQ